jgi:hypothetical protein
MRSGYLVATVSSAVHFQMPILISRHGNTLFKYILTMEDIGRWIVRSYRPHLEERDSIWGDDWSHSSFVRRSLSWGFLGFSSALRKMPRDLSTAPGIISLSPLSLATDVTDVTLRASDLWLGTRRGDGGTATLV